MKLLKNVTKKPYQHQGIFFPFKNCQILYLFETYLLCVAAAKWNILA